LANIILYSRRFDCGPFQTRVVVSAENAVEIPESMGFKEASTIPMAVVTVWAGWYPMGLPKDSSFKAAEKMWLLGLGGASNVGTRRYRLRRRWVILFIQWRVRSIMSI
jgi:NADPH:quinone reductase-like Zn-dependent oxidoreductase